MNAEVSTVAQFEVNFYYVYRVFVGLMLSFYTSNHTQTAFGHKRTLQESPTESV